MASSLLDSTKNYLTDEVIDTISNTLGETPDNTRKALDQALAILLNGLANRVNEPGGASSVMDLTSEVTVPNPVTDELIMPVGGIPANLADFLDNEKQQTALLTMGNDIVQRLFGEQTDLVTNRLVTNSNVTKFSASALLSLAAPLLLGALGNHLANTDTGISGLGPLLNEQAAMTNISN